MKKPVFLLSLLLLNGPYVFADEYLIQEIESLRASLDFGDPARGELTLRLADLYFNDSIKEQKGDLVVVKRKKALDLYRSSLEGKEGLTPAVGASKLKIQFQMARLLDKLGEKDKAIVFFKNIYDHQDSPKRLKRESAFSLADWHEKKAETTKADSYYQTAIRLCSTIDSCNYAHYRRGWLLFKDTRLDEAVNEVRQALWDGKGQIREQTLRDFILFLSNKPTDGINELKEIEALSKKIGDQNLIRTLAEAFYAAGNRIAGGNTLTHINNRTPNFYFTVRLIEEDYGFRRWNKVDQHLRFLEKQTSANLPKDKEQRKEVKAIVKRLIVQLDSEVQHNSESVPYLKRSIDLFLKLYPNDEMRRKMQEGWLKVTSNSQQKIERLKIWISEDMALGVSPKEIRKLRQTRLSLAQKQKLSPIIIEESLALAKILKDSDEQREFNYVAAREYYSQKDYAKALPLFKNLADSAISMDKVDKWSILSQNLVLDIFNAQKNFDGIIAQVALWSNSKSLVADKSLAKEMKQMLMISRQANFEKAAAQGESTEALNTFFRYCMEGIYSAKSCENAKVLSVKLKDQNKLIQLLEKSKDEKALMGEYELMGRFSDAAKLQEKFNLNRKSSIETYLKVSLLFELDYDFKNRDRILKKLISKIKREKSLDKKYEKALLITFTEANLFNHQLLSLPWSLATKLDIAHRLEVSNPKKSTQKLLLSQKESIGPAWSKLILEKVQNLDKKQRKISFYGRRSKRLFQRRSKAIERLAQGAKEYLEGADLVTRVYLLNIVGNAYNHFANQIVNTPLPSDLPEETLVQVKANLATMAAPFEKVRDDYNRLREEQLNAMTNEDEKTQVMSNLEIENPDYGSFIKMNVLETTNVANFNYESIKSQKDLLKSKPDDRNTLQVLEQFYKEQKSERVASYFTGRLNSLKD